jgi:hypothetical protein
MKILLTRQARPLWWMIVSVLAALLGLCLLIMDQDRYAVAVVALDMITAICVYNTSRAIMRYWV